MMHFTRMITNKYLFFNYYCNKLIVINAESQIFSGFSQNSLILRYFHENAQNVAIPRVVNKTLNTSSKDNKINKKLISFNELLSLRNHEAKRSVLIQVQSVESYSDLYAYCHTFGPIQNILYYANDERSHFFLVEFKGMNSQKALINSVTHLNHSEIIPVHSQMLWFRNIPNRKNKLQNTFKNIPEMMRFLKKPTVEDVDTALSAAKSVSEQIKLFHDIWKLDDLQIRLRFLTACQLESSFSGLFPNISVVPFGSSVNGFGRRGCDLDLVASLEANHQEKMSSRLVFHTKSAMLQNRGNKQFSMEILASILEYFCPGVVNVRRILCARVPIIKYDHKLTGIECDLSMANRSAVDMSELLFLYGEVYSVVRPLVFTIRQWAASHNITQSGPGPSITNFSLSLMVLFFLQSEKIIPPLEHFAGWRQNFNIQSINTCVDYTLLDEMIKKSKSIDSDKSLETLLADFFQFYANFDFTTKAISLRKGITTYKSDDDSLYIHNPLDRTLNVSKNVNAVRLMTFIKEASNAIEILRTSNNRRSRGLVDLFSGVKLKEKTIGSQKLRIADLFSKRNEVNDKIPIIRQGITEKANAGKGQ